MSDYWMCYKCGGDMFYVDFMPIPTQIECAECGAIEKISAIPRLKIPENEPSGDSVTGGGD